MISYLQADNISRRIGDNLLFENISLNVNKDDKIALIAINGAGKSSLLDIIAGKESPDTGSVSLRRGLKIAYLNQAPSLNYSNRIIDELFTTGSEITGLIKEYEECVISGSQDELQAVIQKMDDKKAWDYDVAVRQVLSKLRLNDLHAKIGTLSGGQKKRVSLAKVLVEEADLLILDEPTNHLDLDMIEWLEEYLMKSNKTLVMVTHDRYFLDRVCNVIIELDHGDLVSYNGNYEYYILKKEERSSNLRIVSERAKNLLRTEIDWMRRMPKARRHKSKSRIDSFYELKDKAALRPDDKNININVNVSRMGNKVLEIKNVSKSYNGIKIIDDFSYTFSRFEKAGIIGLNGSGKTTLLNIITGKITPDTGTVVTGETIVYGYYTQEGIEFDNDMTVIDAIKRIAETVTLSNKNIMTASQFLNYFLFPPEKQYTLIRKLSGGEKRRLHLCVVLMQNPNFLILDEPTNDLDIMTLNVLEDYLSNFPGCVIIVSHDRYFMDKVIDHVFELKNGVITNFMGNYTQLREKQENEEKSASPAESLKETPQRKKEKKSGLSFKEKLEFEKLSDEIKDLESEKRMIEDKMSTGEIAPDELYDLSLRHGNIIQELDLKELRWLELSEK